MESGTSKGKPITKEDVQARVARAISKYQRKPEWLKKRAQRDFREEYLKKIAEKSA